jgi:hypothetical protein
MPDRDDLHQARWPCLSVIRADERWSVSVWFCICPAGAFYFPLCFPVKSLVDQLLHDWTRSQIPEKKDAGWIMVWLFSSLRSHNAPERRRSAAGRGEAGLGRNAGYDGTRCTPLARAQGMHARVSVFSRCWGTSAKPCRLSHTVGLRGNRASDNQRGRAAVKRSGKDGHFHQHLRPEHAPQPSVALFHPGAGWSRCHGVRIKRGI